MIITRDLIISVGIRESFLKWLDQQQDIYGLTRSNFIKALRDNDANQDDVDGYDSEYGLFSPSCIKQHSNTIEHQRWKVWGDGLDHAIEYTDIVQVKASVKTKRDLKLQEEGPISHVHARQIVNDLGGFLCEEVTEENYQHYFANYYAAFNCYTGVYENFDTFWEAKTRCAEINKMRRDEISRSYHIYQFIEEVDNPEENAAGWLLTETAETID